MAKLRPIKRRDLISCLRQLDFTGPYAGGKGSPCSSSGGSEPRFHASNRPVRTQYCVVRTGQGRMVSDVRLYMLVHLDSCKMYAA